MLVSFVNYFTLCCPFTLSDTDVDGLNPCACLNEMRGAVTNRNIWQVGDENWLKHLNQNKQNWNSNWLQRGSLNLFINWSKVKLPFKLFNLFMFWLCSFWPLEENAWGCTSVPVLQHHGRSNGRTTTGKRCWPWHQHGFWGWIVWRVRLECVCYLL